MTGYLAVENLRKTYGGFAAVDGVSVAVAKGQVCALLGPSGCGKTTTLRCIAGLEEADGGTIGLDGRVLFDAAHGIAVKPEARDLGMVFQSYALWPHKSVGENVALGLRIKGLPKGEVRERMQSALDLVGMGGAEARFPGSLSGGQQQRVALARALALRPKCLLFDEPLSNLDLLLRERMRFEIRELLVRLGITAIYVTHDQGEAMVISDQIVVLNHGRIESAGPPAEVYSRPRNRFTAEFLGRTNLLKLDRARSDRASGAVVAVNGTRFASADIARMDEKGDLLIAFRPEAIRLDEPVAAANRFTASVIGTQFLGAATQLVLDLDGAQITATAPGNQTRKPGAKVAISIDPTQVLLLQDDPPEATGALPKPPSP